MISYDRDHVVRGLATALKESGLRSNDSVFLHSSVVPLAIQIGEGDSQKVCSIILDAIRHVIGSDPLIAALTATWETARENRPFEIFATRASNDLGSFPEYLRLHSQSTRTEHPVFSLTFNGAQRLRSSMTANVHRYAFGTSSPWEQMVKENFKAVFIGLNMKLLTLIHHAEHKVGVPYCYNKIFPNLVTKNGTPLSGDFVYNIYYKYIKMAYNDLSQMRESCIESGVLKETSLGSVPISVAGFTSLYEILEKSLSADPYYLLQRPPEYVRGILPADI